MAFDHALQIAQGGVGNQRRDSREIVFNQQLAYPGGGYRRLLEAKPLYFHQRNGWGGKRWRLQPETHIKVVLGGNGTKRLRTDKAVCDAKRGRQILAENLQVDFGITVINNALLFNEIAGERRTRNNVFGAAVNG